VSKTKVLSEPTKHKLDDATLTLICVEDLTKRYGRVQALRQVSFSVEKGVTGLIGPNGAGKSTLIKVLLGLIKATSGKAKLLGLDSRRQRGKIMERVGVLHEKPSLPSWVTARQYLDYVAQLKRLRNVAEEIERVSETCGLAGYVDRRIGTFSAGMTQRLGLADALIGKPDLVILDEPTANLDPLGRYDVLSRIKQLRDREGINFLISTHILSELEKVCDNVVILNEGTVLTHGSLSELIAKSGQRYIIEVNNPKGFIDGLSGRATERVEVVENSIIADVRDEEGFLKEVNELVREGAFTLRELRLSTPTLEDVFIDALRRKQA
jgi:ABC-2 type transport system ATP-binding protein